MLKNLKTFCLLAFVPMLILSLTIIDSNSQTNKKGKSVDKPQYVIHVKQGTEVLGDIVLELYPEVAPMHCAHFDSLVAEKFYDGCAFHRVIPGFMIQGGDPNSKNKPRETWGYGDPSLKTVKAEFSKIPHKRGILSTARSSDINSATSQFFIMVNDYPSLDGKYTVFGEVKEGMEVADKIVNTKRDRNDNPEVKVEMTIEKK